MSSFISDNAQNSWIKFARQLRFSNIYSILLYSDEGFRNAKIL